MRPTAPPMFERARTLLLIITLLLAAPRLAHAQAFTWLVPAGGETWTAGTTHSVEWSGGPSGSNINVQVISMLTASVVGNVTIGMPYGFVAPWSLPIGLPPGQYQLYIEDVPTTTWTYGPVFNVQGPTPCAVGCTYVSVGPQYYGGYPGTSCATTAPQALANAQTWLNTQLANACSGGSVIDPSSVVADYTSVPLGVCEVGQFGAFQVEATALACCCSGATPTRRSSWGQVKTIYR